MEKLRVVTSLRLYSEGKAFGPGVAALLDGIVSTGSLRQSALALNMSYNKAWNVLKECESNLGYPLVTRAIGGKNGGGSVLTEEGRRLLKNYRAFCKDAAILLDVLAKKHFEEGL